MPYQCDDNYELYMEYVGKLSALIEEPPTSYVAILGDFNAGIDTQFEAELRELYMFQTLTMYYYLLYLILLRSLLLLTPLHVSVTKLILIGKKPLTKIY